MGQFWRALRYLGPHRRLVIASIVCAFIVGAAFTGGIGTMLPILRVLVNGDSVEGWIYRQTAARRLDARLLEDPARVQVERVTPNGAAARAGLEGGEQLLLPNGLPEPDQERQATTELLRLLASPQVQSVQVMVRQGSLVTLELPPPPTYLLMGQRIAERMPRGPVAQVAAVFALMASLTMVGNVVRFFQEYLSDKAAILAVSDVRRQLYDHVLHVPLGYFSLKGTSDMTSRLVHDTGTLQEGFKTVLGRTIQEPIKAVMIFMLALLLNWKLTLFIAIFAPVMFVLIRKFGNKMRRAARRALQNSALMLGHLEGTLAGIRVVKAADAERFERRRFRRILGDVVHQHLRISKVDAMSTPVLETMSLIVAGAIVLYAAYLVLVTRMLEPGIFIMVMLCLVGMADSLRKISKVNNSFQKANAAAARIFETFAIPVERPRKSRHGPRRRSSRVRGNGRPAEPARLIKLPPIQREVRFEQVTFSYSPPAPPVLSDVDLVVRKGECVAVVGRNGSGKTTLLSLLPRFYDPQEGRVLIDGVDVRQATLRSLRRQIGIVTQDSVIFPGTIAENIAYGNPRASREQIIAAAKRAFAHDFIMEKQQDYDTLLGEMGAGLSGGQKQRLCLARAILRDSPVLILDEATSQVDAESEHLIQQAIESLMHQRTTFVIAHRLNTILSADRIIVMDRGQIVGQGTHEELLASCTTYQQLYERQLFTVPPPQVGAVELGRLSGEIGSLNH